MDKHQFQPPPPHLLAQQRTAAALDHIKLGVHLISTINSHIQLGLLVQGGQRDAQACAERESVPRQESVPRGPLLRVAVVRASLAVASCCLQILMATA